MITNTCPACSATMAFISSSPYVKGKNTYLRRKYKCPVCDHQETIIADNPEENRVEGTYPKKGGGYYGPGEIPL